MSTLATFFNLGGPDLLVILLIVLILFGAKKLPELAKGMGQAIKEFNKAKDEIDREINKPVNEFTTQQPQQTLPHQPVESKPVEVSAPSSTTTLPS
jgi:sec-independent protein translocase protein TatA